MIQHPKNSIRVLGSTTQDLLTDPSKKPNSGFALKNFIFIDFDSSFFVSSLKLLLALDLGGFGRSWGPFFGIDPIPMGLELLGSDPGLLIGAGGHPFLSLPGKGLGKSRDPNPASTWNRLVPSLLGFFGPSGIVFGASDHGCRYQLLL
jgi:hypothetical protein